MTDKQIIINGVDVSGCDFLAKKDDYCSYSGVTYAYKGQCMCSDEEMCKEHPKCFYKKVLKQLKCKEQECEELRKANDEKNELLAKLGCPTIATAKRKVFCLQEQLDQLKAENDELKKQHQGDKGLITSTGKMNYQLIQEYDKLKEEKDELKVMFKDLSYENQKFSYQIEDQTKQLEPFKDEYFKGLETIVIAELAKKSIRITAENRKLEQTLTEIKEIAEAHKKDESVWNPYRQLDKILQKISECEVE